MMAGETLPIAEAFTSIQGEGVRTGSPSRITSSSPASPSTQIPSSSDESMPGPLIQPVSANRSSSLMPRKPIGPKGFDPVCPKTTPGSKPGA